MNRLSLQDKALLAADLPELKTVHVPGSILLGHENLEYREAGDVRLPTAVFLHGLGSSSAGFRGQLAGLCDSFHVIAWDSPGFGNSDGLLDNEPDVDRYVDALEGFLTALKIHHINVLVGSSFGSVIAVAYARRYPSKVGHLVLSGANTGRGNVIGADRDRELADWLRTADVDIPVSRKDIADRLLPPDAPQEVRERVERLRDALTSRGWQQAIRMMYTIYTPDIVEQIPCRIDLITGQLDLLAPHEGHAALIGHRHSNAQLWLLPGIGHMPKLECPDLFNQIVSR